MTTPRNTLPLVLALLGALFLSLLVVVAHNDAGSTTEVALLQGTPVVATDNQCDALYEAIYRVKGEKNHYQLINLAYTLDCPMEDE